MIFTIATIMAIGANLSETKADCFDDCLTDVRKAIKQDDPATCRAADAIYRQHEESIKNCIIGCVENCSYPMQ